MASLTFINQNADNTIKQIGLQHLLSRIEDIEFLQEFGHCEDLDELREEIRSRNENPRTEMSFGEMREALRMYEEISNFNNYGLGFGFVDAGTFNDQKEGYYRYQLSWGGPSDEIRFYQDGTVEYVFMDWFCGVGFDVTGEDWAEWLKGWFEDVLLIDWDSLEYEQIHGEYFDDEEE